MAKQKGNTSSALNSAKKAKNDEFYTQRTDIDKELYHYRDYFRGKTVFCNCDDPCESNFFKYFALNFNTLGLKKLIATCYAGSPIANKELSLSDHESPENKMKRNPHKIEISEVIQNPEKGFDLTDVAYLLRNEKNVLTRLKGNGDFRSDECIELLKQADIVCTNPPFSLFREYVAQLMEYEKNFLIIGNDNAITYKEFFRMIKENAVWSGYSRVKEFSQLDGTMKKFGNVGWFTNLDISKRYEELTFYKRYNAKEYPKYDNYNAIEVSKVAEIPMDYEGCMGVPISFLDKYNPEQFEILGQTGVIDPEDILIEYKGGRPYINGKRLYSRIIIRKKRNSA